MPSVPVELLALFPADHRLQLPAPVALLLHLLAGIMLDSDPKL